jgi:ubiquinol-cytochrome c reductase cytochrome c1 subunit
LIGVSHHEDEAKEEAEAIEVIDGPDDKGEMFTRPGKVSFYSTKKKSVRFKHLV